MFLSQNCPFCLNTLYTRATKKLLGYLRTGLPLKAPKYISYNSWDIHFGNFVTKTYFCPKIVVAMATANLFLINVTKSTLTLAIISTLWIFSSCIYPFYEAHLKKRDFTPIHPLLFRTASLMGLWVGPKPFRSDSPSLVAPPLFISYGAPGSYNLVKWLLSHGMNY